MSWQVGLALTGILRIVPDWGSSPWQHGCWQTLAGVAIHTLARCPRGEKLLSQVHTCIDTNFPHDELMKDDNTFNDNLTYFKSLSRAEMVMSLFKTLMFSLAFNNWLTYIVTEMSNDRGSIAGIDPVRVSGGVTCVSFSHHSHCISPLLQQAFHLLAYTYCLQATYIETYTLYRDQVTW